MYLERKFENGKYTYRVECPSCLEQRWVSNARASRCSSCGGKESHNPAVKERSDKRRKGDGYISKQGYHLVYEDGGYKPAHRLKFPDLSDDMKVHHVNGNKLDNELDNLYPCDLQNHRYAHASLEKLSYFLVQNGYIDFSDGKYSFNPEFKDFLQEAVIEPKEGSVTIDGEIIQPTTIGRIKCQ